jgi:hypothetical protein
MDWDKNRYKKTKQILEDFIHANEHRYTYQFLSKSKSHFIQIKKAAHHGAASIL